jgi:predicted deoxyguanosinetriphosphate triphosphohydrolase
LGNPPFGHSGEKAIQTFFSEGPGQKIKSMVSSEFWDDITHFEGNANAFRILTHRFKGRRQGGFVMTYSMLASIVKYPFASSLAGNHGKFGFFASETESYRKIADELGIFCKSAPGEPLKYARHPLVYMVEAADDICYEIMDIESCRKIKYMFPKAHAVAYLMAAIRLMWFKVYHPAIFYAVYFTVRGADIDYEAAVGGVRVAKQHLRDNEKIPKDERTAKDDDALVSLQLENEMLQRGCEFLPIELGRSYASKYVVEDGKVRLPFTAIRGLGDAAAAALEQATMHGQEYISVEELQQASGVAQSVFDKLRAVGALGNLPETSQVDLFSMI